MQEEASREEIGRIIANSGPPLPNHKLALRAICASPSSLDLDLEEIFDNKSFRSPHGRLAAVPRTVATCEGTGSSAFGGLGKAGVFFFGGGGSVNGDPSAKSRRRTGALSAAALHCHCTALSSYSMPDCTAPSLWRLTAPAARQGRDALGQGRGALSCNGSSAVCGVTWRSHVGGGVSTFTFSRSRIEETQVPTPAEIFIPRAARCPLL